MHLKEVQISITAHVYSWKECTCEAWINHHCNSIHCDHRNTMHFVLQALCFAEWRALLLLPLLCAQSTPQYVTHLFNMPMGAVAQKYYISHPCLAATLRPPTTLLFAADTNGCIPTGLKHTALGEVTQATLMSMYYNSCILLVTNSQKKRR